MNDRRIACLAALLAACHVALPASAAPAELEAVRRRLSDASRTGLGDSGLDSVLRRSFSLLDLSVLAAHDLKKPFMPESAFEEMLAVAMMSLDNERDLRGYEAGVGWVHATAHAADLLKFLARNPKLTVDGQRRVVAAVRYRLQDAGIVFAWVAVRAQVNALTHLAAMLGRTDATERVAVYERELQETLAAVAL